MALRYYDINTNDYRDCTQADLDELLEIRKAYGRIQARFQEDRAQLLVDLKAIRSRAGMPNDLMVDAPLPVSDDAG
jgi:hypothetical protein